MKPDFALSCRQGDALSKELLTLLAAGNPGPGIRNLAINLRMSRKETLNLLVTLENHGVLIWDFSSRQYRPDPDVLLALLQGEAQPLSNGLRSSTKPPQLTKAA